MQGILIVAVVDPDTSGDRDAVLSLHSVFFKNLDLALVVGGSRNCRDISAVRERIAPGPFVARF
jgi:hypothetical protein